MEWKSLWKGNQSTDQTVSKREILGTDKKMYGTVSAPCDSKFKRFI